MKKKINHKYDRYTSGEIQNKVLQTTTLGKMKEFDSDI